MPEKPEQKLIEIRASGLPGAMDCWRKWAMQMATDPKSGFAPIMQKHGFDIPERKNGIGAAIGTSCHAGFGKYLQAKVDGYNADPEQLAVSEFRQIEKGGLEYDRSITKDSNTALIQIKRLISAYAPHAEKLQPKLIEYPLKTRPDPIKEYLVTGHADLCEITDDWRDWKFGRFLGSYEAQLGTYSLMARSMGLAVRKLLIDWIPRTSITQPQKPLTVIEYDRRTAENAAHYMIEESLERLEKFKETGNEWAFMANPNSKLCSKTWCPAWQSSFCDLGRPESNKDD